MTAGARLTRTGLERFDETVEQAVGDERVPGLVALVGTPDDLHVKAAGSLTLGGPPVTTDSLFRIASTTKPITAALTLALVRDGLFGLDEPVERLLPELADRRVLTRMDGPLTETVPAQRSITVRDLLTFTFGLGMVLEMFLAPEPWPVVAVAAERRLATFGPPEPSVPPDPNTWMAGLGSLPLLAQPGERWMYNTGAQVLGVLASRATGQPIDEVYRSRLFEPLGMPDTGFWTAETHRLATGYRPAPDGLVAWDEPDGQWSRKPAFADGAAGLLSTAADLYAFARMLLEDGGSLLAADDVRAMTRDQLTPQQKAYGGLGPDFFAGRSWGFCQMVHDDGSFGWDGGLGSSWRVDPAHDLVMIVLTQRMFDSPETPQLHLDIQAAARAALG